MSQELTAIERGTLVALMAAGGSLQENADLRVRFGISVRPAHRTKLQGMGFITTTKKPLTHELTENGWAWLRNELRRASNTSVPKGQMGLGALHALFGRIDDYARKSEIDDPLTIFRNPTGVSKPKPNPEQELYENAWRLADESLAKALQQTLRLRMAIEPAAGLDRELRRSIGETIDALRHASRTRQMAIVGQADDVAGFDADYHAEDDQRFRNGDKVKIIKPAVVQGEGACRRVIRKAEVCAVG